MYPIFIAAFITIVFVLLNIRFKHKRSIADCMAIFFLIAGINFLFSSSKAQAQQFDLFKEKHLTFDSISNQIIVKVENKTKKPKKSLREINIDFMIKYKNMMDYHFEEGCRCLKEAEEACLWFPDISEKEKAQMCLANFIAA